MVDRTKEQISSIVVDANKEEFPRDFETFDPKLKAITIDQIFYLLKERIKQDMGLENDIDAAKEGEENGDINESLNKIKSEFKRKYLIEKMFSSLKNVSI